MAFWMFRKLEEMYYQRQITRGFMKEAEGDPNLEKYYRAWGRAAGVLAQTFAETKRDYPNAPIDSLSFIPINPWKIRSNRSEYLVEMKAYVETRPPRMVIGILTVDDDGIVFVDELVSYVQGGNICNVLAQDYINDAFGEKGRKGKSTLLLRTG